MLLTEQAASESSTNTVTTIDKLKHGVFGMVYPRCSERIWVIISGIVDVDRFGASAAIDRNRRVTGKFCFF